MNTDKFLPSKIRVMTACFMRSQGWLHTLMIMRAWFSKAFTEVF